MGLDHDEYFEIHFTGDDLHSDRGCIVDHWIAPDNSGKFSTCH